MEIRLAKTSGFCFGVKRAVDTVSALAKEQNGTVYTYGPIIHNEDVIAELAAKGVRILHAEEDIDTVEEGTIVIRSHGISKAVYLHMLHQAEITDGRVKIVDATCPFVKKIHKTVEKESLSGKQIIICGDASHPEVQGIMGWCETPANVISSVEDAEKISGTLKDSICVVAQTTFIFNKFKQIIAFFGNLGYDTNDSVVNTICNATEERQTEARKLSGECDAMIVIGSRNSSNTRKLYDICKRNCEATYFVQSADDLVYTTFTSFRCVGITAGASTPKTIIKEVQEVMSEENFEQMLNDSLKTIHNGEVVEGT